MGLNVVSLSYLCSLDGGYYTFFFIPELASFEGSRLRVIRVEFSKEVDVEISH